MESIVSSRLATLGHPPRLAVFRLLMRRYPDRVPATEIAIALGLKPNTLSVYVNALMQADLITLERLGTSRRYAINMNVARDTFDYLLLDCCRGRPEVCAPVSGLGHAGAAPKVLFLCTGSAARSLMAQTLLRDMGDARFEAFSAGTQPRSAPHPMTLEVLARNGHDTASLTSKHVSQYQSDTAPRFNFVITVCDAAANEECPAWAGAPFSAHWGLPDPVALQGMADTAGAFQNTYNALRARIRAFAALPLTSLDPLALQQALDQIGQIPQGAST